MNRSRPKRLSSSDETLASSPSPKRPRPELSDDSDSELFATRIVPVTPGRTDRAQWSICAVPKTPPSPSVESLERRNARLGSISPALPSAEDIQGMLTSMSPLPAYIKRLERKCRALQGSVSGRSIRIQQLEAELNRVKREKESIELDNQRLMKENERLAIELRGR
ncbi:hypothetical protein APHAL10511_003690 [Amanita phalloides]|nr:hypothetical protein APHAL10511_003690 [Amanita phalloides]